jgi:hypothetical protein
MISLIHASRSRPKVSRQTIQRWITRCSLDELEVVVSLDKDDPMLMEYTSSFCAFTVKRLKVTILKEDNKSSVEAINRAARAATGDIFIVVSDDTDCPTNWGPKILRYCAKHKDFVLKVQDGFQNRIITMPIMDRAYFDRDKFIYDPRFDHLFADTWFTDVAYRRKRVIAKNIMFMHNQYSIIGAPIDAIYEKNNKTYETGKRTYQQLRKTLPTII